MVSNLTQRVAHTLGKHFVTLSCIQHPHTGSGEEFLLFSGFVVDVHGEWFLITAGHILDDIRVAIEAGSVFDVWRIDDQTAGNKFRGRAIPYDFNLTEWMVIRNKEIGHDYATVHIGGLYRQQLEAGGVIPVDRNGWLDATVDDDYWVLVGVPYETVEYDGITQVTARVVTTPLSPAETPPGAGKKSKNQFYAKVVEGEEYPFNHPGGMSGGPVFALKKSDEDWRYGVIGVQSAWYPEVRTLAICPFISFGMIIEEAIGTR